MCKLEEDLPVSHLWAPLVMVLVLMRGFLIYGCSFISSRELLFKLRT